MSVPEDVPAGVRTGVEQLPDRVFTVPNLLSALRLAGVPVFLWLVLGPRTATADLGALAVLVGAGVSDWLDGRLARAWNQTSRLGALLDPVADRLYILATLLAFVLRGVIPWWLGVLIVARDVVLTLALGVLRYYGYSALQVHFLGKAATFNLLYAFPFLLLSVAPDPVGAVARPIGWAFAIWGVGLYWWSAMLYLEQVVTLIRAERGAAAGC
jgi:cardiolipin synthase